MSGVEKPKEICASPEELNSLFDQWRKSSEGKSWKERVLFRPHYIGDLELLEPLSSVAFGIFLAQETFPIAKKFSDPPILVTRSGRVKTMVSSKDEGIVVSNSFLRSMTEQTIPSTRLISGGVEENAHWVLMQAISVHNGRDYIKDLDRRYSSRLNKVEKLMRRFDKKFETIKGYNWQERLRQFFTGVSDQQIEQLQQLLDLAYAAYIEHSAGPEEFMGVLWREKVGQRYYPWAEATKTAESQLKRILEYKKLKFSAPLTE